MTVPGRSRTRSEQTYTIPEAAEALGKSISNFRRWLEADLLPSPVLVDAGKGHACYSAGELEIIARELASHERNFAYLCAKHTDVITRISQLIHGHRDMAYGLERA